MRKEFFDNCANDWVMPGELQSEIIKQKIIPMLELKKDESILDACGGPGTLIPFLKEYGVKITEFDFSEKMIEKAKADFTGEAEFIVGNIENMPFEDGTFSKIICHNSLPHIEDKQKAFKECFRVLKNGGILVISHDSSKKAVDEHHKKCNKAVSNDMMPSNKDITLFAAYGGFETVEIQDEERFFAVICKK